MDFSALIKQQLQEIEQQIQSLQQAAQIVTLDQSRVGRLSRMDALQSQAMHVASLCRLQVQQRALRHAQKRVLAEDFGYCQSCGEDIAIGRLKFNPAVLLCIDCAENADN